MTTGFDFDGVTVLWDNDATLVDSEIIAMKVAVDSVFDYFDKLGLTRNVPVADRKKYEVEWAGKQISQMFEKVGVWTDHIIPADVLAELCADDARRVIVALEKVEAIEGIAETLSELRHAGAEQAVVTSSSLLRVVPGLQNNDLDRFFIALSGIEGLGTEPRIWSATETLENDERYGKAIPKSSTSPQIYEFALDATKAQPGKVIAIEDSASGVGAAVAAGIPVVGLTAASHISAENKEAHAQMLIDKVSEVLGRPATEKDIVVVHDARDIPETIGRMLDLPVVARKVEGADLKLSATAQKGQLGDR